MLVEIFNFRCISYRKIELPDSGTVLFRGDNGAGKSTTFLAIRWCLYGKLLSVKNKSETSGRPSVILTSGDLTVQRWANTADLLVIFKGVSYKGAEGQGIIDAIYGNLNTWTSSCYLAQDCLHMLCKSKADDRYRLIYDLTFGDTQNPNDQIEKVEKEVKKCNEALSDIRKEQLKLEGKIGQEVPTCFRFSEVMEYENSILSLLESIESSASALKDAEKERRIVEKKLTERGVLEDRISESEKILEEVERKLADYDVKMLNDERERLEKEALNIDKAKKRASRLRELSRGRHVFDALNDEKLLNLMMKWGKDISPLGKTLGSAKKRAEVNVEESVKYDKWQADRAEYDKEKSRVVLSNKNLELEIMKAEENNKLADIYDKYSGLLMRIESYPVHNTSKEELLTRKSEIVDKLSEHVCPCCENSLVMRGGKLIKGKRFEERSDLEKELSSIKELEEEWVKYEKDKRQMESIASIYGNIDPRKRIDVEGLRTGFKKTTPGPFDGKCPYQEVKASVALKSFLEDMTSLGASFDDLSVVDLLSGVKLLDEWKELTSQSPGCCYSAEAEQENRDRLSALMQGLRRMSELFGEKKALISSIDSSRQKLSLVVVEEGLIERIDSVIRDAISNIKSLEEGVMALRGEKNVFELGNRRDNLERNAKEILDKLSGLDRLLKLSESLTYESMKEITESIQASANKVLETIYEGGDGGEPMRVVLKTEKESKGGKGTNCINIEVVDKGIVYGNVDDLSGGEKNLLSFALVVALSKTSNSKFLILDESFNSISESKRPGCMNAVEEYLSDKCVCFVLHITNPDMYTKVIEI